MLVLAPGGDKYRCGSGTGGDNTAVVLTMVETILAVVSGTGGDNTGVVLALVEIIPGGGSDNGGDNTGGGSDNGGDNTGAVLALVEIILAVVLTMVEIIPVWFWHWWR